MLFLFISIIHFKDPQCQRDPRNLANSKQNLFAKEGGVGGGGGGRGGVGVGVKANLWCKYKLIRLIANLSKIFVACFCHEIYLNLKGVSIQKIITTFKCGNLRADAPKSLQKWNHGGHWNFLKITTLNWNVGCIIN